MLCLFCSLWCQEMARNPTWMGGGGAVTETKKKKKRKGGGGGERGNLKTWKAKRKESLWRSKEELHLQTNNRRFPAITWGPGHVWGSYSTSDNIRSFNYNGQWMRPRCKATLLVSSNSFAGPESVNEAFCNHGDRSAPLWSLHRNEKQKMKRGEGKKDSRTLVSLSRRAQTFPRDAGVSALPRWADTRAQGWRTSTHTHSAPTQVTEDAAPPTLSSFIFYERRTLTLTLLAHNGCVSRLLRWE